MSGIKDLQIYLSNDRDNDILNITNSSRFYIDKKEILRIFNLNNIYNKIYKIVK